MSVLVVHWWVEHRPHPMIGEADEYDEDEEGIRRDGN